MHMKALFITNNKLSMIIDLLMGWVFLAFSLASIGHSITHAILWLILSKICWLHLSVKEIRHSKVNE